jgi:putative flippase GtrA
MEIMVRYPRLRLAEVPFSMAPRHAGASKASLAEGVRFGRHLLRLRTAVLRNQARRSASTGSPRVLARMILFGLVGLSGLLVNTAVLMLLGLEFPRLHYLIAATLATEASTTWLFLLTERVVFRGPKPGSVGSRAVRFFLLNHVALLARLPVLALAVEWLGIPVVPANVATLVLLFLVRFVVADAAIYGAGADSVPLPPREPMRVVVGVAVAPAPDPGGRDAPEEVPGARVNGVARPAPEPAAAPVRGRAGSAAGHRFLPYRYAIPGVVTIGSQVRLRELEYFRAQYLGHDTDIQLRVAPTGSALPRSRATMMQLAEPPSISYSEHLGRLGANFHVRLGEPIVVTVAPPLARSPHVVYTNILEALLRFVAVSRGAMLLHSACLEVDGAGVLISAETDTGKTGTVLRMVRERGARFLSDDMTVLHSDGRIGCFPKPLTISHHTLRAIGNDELSAGEWRKLRLQSRLHSKEGRQFAMLLARLNIPIMGVNALTQYLVPPPKYTVDRLLPCEIVPTTTATELFVISRGPHGAGELDRSDAMRTLLANTEDAYQFPPFRQLAPSVVIGGADHAELRRREREILGTALERIRCRWIATPDFSWADEIPRTLADDAEVRQRQLSSA